jgi:hypothetical protein
MMYIEEVAEGQSDLAFEWDNEMSAIGKAPD